MAVQEMNTRLDAHDLALIEKAKHTIWENALFLMDQAHSEEAKNIISEYCRSQFHKYED